MRCGSTAAVPVEMSGVASFACEPCLDEFAERQRQFAELIEAGVPRASANMIMVNLIDQAGSN